MDRRWLTWLALACCAAFVLNGRDANADTLDSLYTFPLGVPAGSASDVTVSGVPRWPLQVHCPYPKIRWQCLDAKGALRVTVPPDTPGQLIWFRLYDRQGASSWLPLAIGTTQRRSEQEPNDRLVEATSVDLPIVVDGRLGKSGDVDTVAVELAAGEQLVARMTSNWIFQSPVDAVLQVVDEKNNVLWQNHDDRGLDPTLVFTAKAAGVYFVRCFGFPATPNTSIRFSGSAAYVYQLELTTGPALDAWLPAAARIATDSSKAPPVKPIGWNLAPPLAVLPSVRDRPVDDERWHWLGAPSMLGLAPLRVVSSRWHVVALDSQDRESTCHDIQPPTLAFGVVNASTKEDCFRFRASKGSAWRIRLVSESLGYRLDPWLRIMDAQGKQLAEFDDSARQPDLDVVWKAPTDGVYTLLVADRFRTTSPRAFYSLSIAPEEPAIELQLDQHHWETKVGQAMRIKVHVTRSSGWNRDCQLLWEGLPAAIRAPAVTLKGNKKKESVEVDLEVPGDYAGPFSFPVRLRAAVEAQTVGVARAATSRPFAPADALWITVTASK